MGAYENMYYQIILGKMIVCCKEKMVNSRTKQPYHLITIYLDPKYLNLDIRTEDIQVEDIYDLFKYMYLLSVVISATTIQ